MRAAAAAAALVEQHDAIARRVEEAPRFRIAAGARPAVQEHDGLARGIAAFLPVDLVAVADGQVAVTQWLDRRVEFATRVHVNAS